MFPNRECWEFLPLAFAHFPICMNVSLSLAISINKFGFNRILYVVHILQFITQVEIATHIFQCLLSH